MKSYIVLGCLLVSLAYVLGGETDLKDSSIDRYREMLNSFETKVKRIYRELHNKAYSDKQFVNNKLEGSMAAVRSKRETEPADIQAQVTGALQNLQKMFEEAKSSDGAKQFMEKLNEFGSNLQSAGQQFGTKFQETIQQFSKGQQQEAS